MCRTSLLRLISSAVAALPTPPTRNAVVNVALSGGVDSSVAAFLLQERGWRVRPILMRCWDDDDDDGERKTAAAPPHQSCFERELIAAQAAASALQLKNPVTVFDFVKEYWLDVFESVFLAGLAAGDTPNPDIACNKYVKFGAFPARLRAEARIEAGADSAGSACATPLFATGHYARTRLDSSGLPLLLRAQDERKDQTYFLAGLSATDLKSAIFPLGSLLKSQTRDIAEMCGLPSAKARSSRGICFVGKRPLAPFLDKYLSREGSKSSGRGTFVDADSGTTLGQLPCPAFNFTIGQRARIGGQKDPFYVCDKTDEGNVLVSKGSDSCHLFTRELFCRDVNWIAGTPPEGFGIHSEARLRCKSNSTGILQDCVVALHDKGLKVRFDTPTRRISPGQVVVLYDEDICLGGGTVGK